MKDRYVRKDTSSSWKYGNYNTKKRPERTTNKMERIKRIYPSQHSHKWKCFIFRACNSFSASFQVHDFLGRISFGFFLSFDDPFFSSCRGSSERHLFLTFLCPGIWKIIVQNRRILCWEWDRWETRGRGTGRSERDSGEGWAQMGSKKKDFLSEDSIVEAAGIRKFEQRLCELEHFY